ncbi:phosphate ABC transporter permease PstA [Glycomyces tenuis]|uniref:phosphate ABC transporter permease PstA n=1 Tax=Glycomyces tenuis TaxID=58116 RepID=UPI0004259D93|nr:phosphate ABC transporter permease PstA [Glycomyces tenuis]
MTTVATKETGADTEPPEAQATEPDPDEPAVEEADAPRRIRSADADDRIAQVGSAAGSLGLVWILYHRVLPTEGLLGFVLCWWIAFLLLYALVTVQRHGRVVLVDRIAAAVVRSAAVVVAAALVTVIAYTFWRGGEALVHANFYTEDLVFDDSTDLSQGGIRHAIVGTLEMMGLSIAFTLPLGVACAVFLSEVRGRLSRIVRTIVEAMTALPSIAAGLFILVALILALGVEQSGLAASLALSVMMLPIITRAADVGLRLVPGGLREASLALGASQWRTVWHVVLPTARPALATALIIGVARGVGETSPVVLTAGYTNFLNANPLSGWQTSLPPFIYNNARLPEEEMVVRAFGAASVLLTIVLILFVISRIIATHRGGRRS